MSRRHLTHFVLLCGLPLVILGLPSLVFAQRADENVITSAEDAFGTTVGRESLGIYNEGSIRGFSPGSAGNYRIEGLYFDEQSNINSRVEAGSTIRVGPAAQGYAFPSPTGIVDISLRSSGDKKTLSSLLDVGPFDSYGAELDGQFPVISHELSTALGASYYHNHFYNGGRSDSISIGVVPRWHPIPQLEIKAFVGSTWSLGETSQGVYIAEGPFVPANIERGQYPGPPWANTDNTSINAGVLARAILGAWTVRAGIFHSSFSAGPQYQNLVLLDESKTEDREVIGYPSSGSNSTSGEFRISRAITEGPREHLFTLMTRGRLVDAQYGGEDDQLLGTEPLNSVLTTPRPSFDFGPLTDDKVSQFTGGGSYGLRWKHLGELTLGLARTHFAKDVMDPGVGLEHRTDDVWLPSVSAAATLTQHFSIYGSFVRGLEDAGTAPGFATNGNQVLPPIQTHQWDAGLRWSAGKNTLIAGLFDITKPYLALDKTNFYHALGTETHRGFEASLTSEPEKGLTVVIGAVWQRPRVTNSLEPSETVGAHPVGQSAFTAQLSANWVVPKIRRLSLDGAFSFQTRQPGAVDDSVYVPAYATLDLGLRYRLRTKTPTTFRLLVSNVTNSYGWNPFGGGVYVPTSQRAITAYLTADF